MNPHRSRRVRKDGAAIVYLREWRRHVERTERRVRKGGHLLTDCPYCDGAVLDDSRERLEGLMRAGGRRAHRLRVAVTELDERYRDVTVETTAFATWPWWVRRIPRN